MTTLAQAIMTLQLNKVEMRSLIIMYVLSQEAHRGLEKELFEVLFIMAELFL